MPDEIGNIAQHRAWVRANGICADMLYLDSIGAILSQAPRKKEGGGRSTSYSLAEDSAA